MKSQINAKLRQKLTGISLICHRSDDCRRVLNPASALSAYPEDPIGFIDLRIISNTKLPKRCEHRTYSISPVASNTPPYGSPVIPSQAESTGYVAGKGFSLPAPPLTLPRNRIATIQRSIYLLAHGIGNHCLPSCLGSSQALRLLSP